MINERWIGWKNHEIICWIKIKNLIDDNSEDRIAKGRKKCIIKRKHKFEDYKNCLEATQIENEVNL